MHPTFIVVIMFQGFQGWNPNYKRGNTKGVLSQPYFEGMWEDETHTPKIGTWESLGTPETLEFDCRGQNTSHWGVFYIIGNLSKCRCRKWPCMGHLDICSTNLTPNH